MARILVCEDSPTQALHVRIILDSVGHEVTVTNDAQGALDLLRETPFDLVLVDVQMQGINGIELCRRIRQQPSLGSLPVVIMTELREMDDLRRGQEAGANTWIVKPFDPDGFLRRIDRFLPQRERSTTRFGGIDSGEMEAVATSSTSTGPIPHAHAAQHPAPPPSPEVTSMLPPPPPAPSLAVTLAHPALHLPSSLPVANTRSTAPPTPPRPAPPVATPSPPATPPPSERPRRSSRSPLSQVLGTLLLLSEQAITHPSTPELRDILLALHQAARHASELMATLAEDAAAAAAPTRTERAAASAAEAEFTLVLVVSADSLRRLLELYLERHGMNVHAVASTAEAIDFLHVRARKVDLLVTELTQVSQPLLETLGRDGADIPILYILDHEDPGSKRHLLPEHAPVLVKPFTAGTLLEKVHELLPSENPPGS